ncbi:MAG: RecQ family ATP-dependent DNA helicase [Chloroflexi bacterium]|nr:RecQ family ATP-dependent DNA helicase [Chloroflexota bacterium]
MSIPEVDTLRQLISDNFGLSEFRLGQREAITHVLNGRHTLVVMPTGSGKSLVYQACALALPGTALIISPLIALMKDQVDRLQTHGIAATFINSSLSSSEQTRRMEKLRRGEYRMVYIAPERLRSRIFLEALRTASVSLLAVDEAHCISQWGHDFRPDYLTIGAMREALGNPVTLALTATATPDVQNDIVRQLNLGDASRVVTGFARANLVFHVRFTPDLRAKQNAIRKVLGAVRGAGIIYVGTRREAEDLAATIEAEFHVSTYVYHGGMDRNQRSLVQDAYLHDPGAVMIATNAFGMGVDRPDVRFVIHYSIPGTLEAYYQEAGRAGRDGRLAQCMLLYAPQDRNLQEWFIENDSPSRNELMSLHRAISSRVREEGIAKVSPDELIRATRLFEVKMRVGLSQLERYGSLERLRDDSYGVHLRPSELSEETLDRIQADVKLWRQSKREKLDKMINYAEITTQCRQQQLVEHFGERSKVLARPCCDFHIREAKGEPHPDFKQMALAAQPAPTTGDARQNTVDVTAGLFHEGLTPKEVAVRRGIVINTVFVHAADLIGQGRLEIRRVVSEGAESLIRHAIDKVGSIERLTPIKALLTEHIEYGEIRCVIAELKRMGEAPPSGEAPVA